ncbi:MULTISPECIES: fimbrial protein [Atlantibacter]|uniref:fimbrial protein n=1 Tax=Atlantibacter TaxID=1903434 RepID=UPI0022B76E30|nr:MULTISPECIES: fimbrial protein [Atlantibacter]MCZ7834922.1 fimbrial protein SthA [Atlantibacter hermannii]
MKLGLLKCAIFASLVVSSCATTAMASATITFTGKVIDAACTVVVNEGNSTIDLGDTVKADLAAKGNTGAPKAFDIALNSCPAAGAGIPTKAHIKFSGDTDGDPSYFKNTASEAAPNVGVLLKQGSTVVKADDDNDDIVLPSAGGNVTTHYTAQLVATNTGADKGDVSAVLTYNVSYN